MVQVQLPSNVNRILKICLILAGIGTFAVIALGVALIRVRTENKLTTRFLEVAKDTQVNFEDSLLVYTEKTRDVIGYLHELRPTRDEVITDFIPQVETIGQDLGLDIQLETYKSPLEVTNKKGKEVTENSIAYKIDFFGSASDLNSFMSSMESLSYFIKIESVDFEDLNYIEKDQNTPQNINLIIKLYIRDDTTEES